MFTERKVSSSCLCTLWLGDTTVRLSNICWNRLKYDIRLSQYIGGDNCLTPDIWLTFAVSR
jgi:hypothetical protein